MKSTCNFKNGVLYFTYKREKKRMKRMELTAILYSNKNLDLCYRLNKNCFKMSINLVTCMNFVELSIKTHQLKPQIIFYDLTTTDFNSSHLRALMENKEFKNTKIVFVGKEDNRTTIENLNIDNMSFENINQAENCITNFMDIINFNALNAIREQNNAIELSNQVANLLFTLGFSAKHTGFCYLKEIITNIVLNAGVVSSLVGQQYPSIAVKYKTTPCNIERNIRNAISIAFVNVGIVKWKNVFMDNYINSRPTNREFICICVEKILGRNSKGTKAFAS